MDLFEMLKCRRIVPGQDGAAYIGCAALPYCSGALEAEIEFLNGVAVLDETAERSGADADNQCVHAGKRRGIGNKAEKCAGAVRRGVF